MRISIFYIFLFLFGWHFVAGQSLTVNGVVSGFGDSEPLMGVNIFVESEPGIGTVSDFEGAFTLTQVPEDAKLVFRYLGYQTQVVPIHGQTDLRVVLSPDDELLQEVVVTAIGIEREEKSLGYAAQQIESEELIRGRQTNVINALAGKVAGLEVVSSSGQPGASANINIRGRTSLTGNNSPLFVVDGVPIDNDFAGSNFIDHSNRAIDLNSDDIESVTVLKGAAAAALYGVRAGNGAIIIQTKRGSAARSEISFSQSLIFDRVNKLPHIQQKYAQGRIENGVPVYVGPSGNGLNSSWGPDMDTLRYDGDNNYAWDPRGRIVGMNHPDATSTEVMAFDNAENFFETAIHSNSNLSFSGGSGQSNYLISGSYLHAGGIIPNTDFQRVSVRMSGNTKVHDRIRLSGSANFVNSGGVRAQRGSNLSGVMLGLMRTPPSFDLTGGSEDPVNDPNAYSFPDGTQRTYVANYDNPYWSVNKNQSKDEVNRFIGYAQADADITPWLKAMARVGTDFYFEERKSYWDNNSNEFGTGIIFDDLFSFRSINTDVLLTSSHQLNKDIDLSVTVGHNFYTRSTYSYVAEGETFIIPGFYDISNTAAITFVNDRRRQQSLIGLFYDLALGYKGFLYLNTTGRNDWASTLPTQANSFFYPSVNLAFIPTELLDMSTNPVFSYGKIRMSFAGMGNDAPGPYLLDTYYSATSPVLGQTGFLPQSTIGNAALVPERVRSYEAGLDIRFFRNRLGVDFSVYRNLSDGQILQAPVAYSTGFSTFITNAGEVESKGIELMLNLNPVQQQYFNWKIITNFSVNRNTVISLAEGVEDFRFEATGLASTSSRAIAGEPFGVLYGTRWMRNEQGDILIDAQGYPMQDSVPGIVGNPNPDWLLGFTNALEWNNWSLSFLVDIRKGGDIFNGTAGIMKNLGTHRSTENREEDVIIDGILVETGEPNSIPVKYDYEYYRRYPFAGVSEENIEDGSWVRLREVAVNYSLPDGFLQSAGISRMQFGITLRNAWLWTPYSGIDPETNLSGASNAIGRDYFNSPNTKSIGFQLNLTF
jgi:TonB-linked SusC/RagA family outer membrane protein